VARRAGIVAFGLYGGVVYLARQGNPELGDGCPGHQLIALVDDRDLSPQVAWLAEHAGRAQVVLRADSYETQHWAAARDGGLALLPRFRADAEPALRRITTPMPVPAAEIWLGVHREDRQVPRIREVLDCIAAAIRAQSLALNPAEQADGAAWAGAEQRVGNL
jgi:DNA-binding transcriptional LysR family regulator